MADIRFRHPIRSAWSSLVGPGATPTNTAITLGLATVGTVAAPNLANTWNSTRSESLTLRLMAFDLWGGAWVNNTKTCARWYERPGQTDTDHLLFAALHLHPIAVAWLDRREPRRLPGWLWAGAHYGYLLAATFAIRRAGPHRRALGPVLTLAGLALDRAAGPSRAAPWFAPVFYTKLLLGHASAALWPDEALTPA
ncbi:hypothetical protein [Nocardia sp. NPDC051832]|uniref:hypothetical protein n=1 Tax=Nocardia sp. NPDC051832 TaxID=3155673 RepID=UPI00343D7BF7